MKLAANTGLFLIFTMIIGTGFAAENDIREENPSLEFLEFLGSFETENGQWIDPMEIDDLLKSHVQKEITEESNDEKNITE